MRTPHAALPTVATLLVTGLFAGSARAEIVNVLTPTVGPQPDSWSLRAGQSFEGRGGSVDKLALRGNLGLRWQQAPHQLMLVGSVAYGKITGTVNTQSVFAHLRYRWTLADPVTLLAFVQGNHDRFRLLNVRAVAGAGLELRLFRSDWAEWNLGVAIMPEWETLAPEAVDHQGFTLRGSGFLAQAYQLQDWLKLANTSFWQPGIPGLDDFRLLNDFSMQFKVTRFLSLKFAVHTIYDSQPPRGVAPLDWTVTQGIVLKYLHLLESPAG